MVSLNVKIGDYSGASEFTLTDRSKMQYALLIGRTLIQDIAVVDVSRSHIQGKTSPDSLLILMRDDYEKAKKEGINPNEEYDRQAQSKAGMIASPTNLNATVGTDPKSSLPTVVYQKEQTLKQDN